MKTKLTVLTILGLMWFTPATLRVAAKGDEFGAVVKTIEQFYRVKHQSVPFLARAGMKAATTAARIKGGEYKRLAEAGSVRIVFFQDQEFDSRGSISDFKTRLAGAVGDTWSPLVQTLSPKDEEQTYIFIRDAGQKINVMVVTLARHEGTVVQVNLNPRTLALLMQTPEDMGKAITDDAAQDDN
ncbi:MAG TPA: hypothetical protein VGN86_14405 [Pyrinomonadaceae bacterium]|jgi:hypothetical protein|nr:hypothetical protein [Pyrinomonadaceae bacterium]